MKDDLVYIKHIRDAIEKIEDYVKGLDFESFSKDNKTIDAVVREIEIIGEAAKNIGDDFRSSHPDFAFREATDMRNMLVHEYFGVNLKVVWDTVFEDLPKLKKSVKEVLE